VTSRATSAFLSLALAIGALIGAFSCGHPQKTPEGGRGVAQEAKAPDDAPGDAATELRAIVGELAELSETETGGRPWRPLDDALLSDDPSAAAPKFLPSRGVALRTCRHPSTKAPLGAVVLATARPDSGSALLRGDVVLAVGPKITRTEEVCADALAVAPKEVRIVVWREGGVVVVGGGAAGAAASTEESDRAEFKGLFEEALRRVVAEENAVLGEGAASRPGSGLLSGSIDEAAPLESRPASK
jgi:hypothetical protein